MPLNDASIAERVRVEGKDLLTQFTDQRSDAIRDVCRELSTLETFYWNQGTVTITVPSTITAWIDLPANFYSIECVYSEVGVDKKYYDYIDESDVTHNSYSIQTGSYGFYRLQWDETNGKFQIAFLKGPIAGSAIKVLYRKQFLNPSSFPDYMEEAIVKGAVARFCKYLDGDDLPYGMKLESDCYRLVKQHHFVGNHKNTGKPRVAKSVKQLRNQGVNRYGDTTRST